MGSKEDGVSGIAEKLREQTFCPFASAARIALGPEWDDGIDFDENVARISDSLNDFLLRLRDKNLHGFICSVRCDQATSLPEVARSFATFLETLVRTDLGNDCLLKDVEHVAWRFYFRGEPIFLNVFAPCYRVLHPKYLQTGESFLVFFQPDVSFDYCGVHQGARAVKSSIRARFAREGMPYDGSMIDDRIEARLYVSPASLGDAPVRWWDYLATRSRPSVL